MSTLSLVFAFLFGFFVLVLLVGTATVTGRVVWTMIRNSRTPTDTIPARVRRKTVRDGLMGVVGHESYHIEFTCQDGRCLDLEVLPGQYDALGEEDEGLLIVRTDRFIGFKSSPDLKNRLKRSRIDSIW